MLKLVTGGGGPVCNAEQSAGDVDVTAGLAINAVNVRRDINVENGVLVSVAASGKINQIRVSEQADLSGVAWQPYKSAMPYTLSAGHGAKRLFVQVRRASEVQGASIAVESAVKQVSYQCTVVRRPGRVSSGFRLAESGLLGGVCVSSGVLTAADPGNRTRSGGR